MGKVGEEIILDFISKMSIFLYIVIHLRMVVKPKDVL